MSESPSAAGLSHDEEVFVRAVAALSQHEDPKLRIHFPLAEADADTMMLSPSAIALYEMSAVQLQNAARRRIARRRRSRARNSGETTSDSNSDFGSEQGLNNDWEAGLHQRDLALSISVAVATALVIVLFQVATSHRIQRHAR